ncbi:MAG: antitoxin [Geodermatophilaceae bacterium]
MGFLDKVKQLSKGRERQISQAVDKAGDVVNKRTGGKYAAKIDKVEDKIDDTLRPPDTDPPPRPKA